MFCTNCGKELKEGAKFCTRCGKPLGGAGTSPQNAIPTGSIKIDAKDDIKENLNTQKKTNILHIVLLAVGVVIMASIIGVCGYFVLSGKASDILGIHNNKNVSSDDDDDSSNNGKKKKTDGVDDIDNDSENKNLEDGEEFTGEYQDLDIFIRQVDNANFPEVVFYASILDDTGVPVEGLSASDFKITEIDTNGKVDDVSISEVEQVLSSNDKISMQLVLDASGSMDSYSKIDKSKYAANALVEKVGQRAGDKISIIAFDDYVYLIQDFTSAKADLSSAIDSISTGGSTALYDGIYAGLTQTYYEKGVKCVIALTDGEENASSYTFDDVISLAKQTAIPVFIIGVGDYGYDASELQVLANECSGRYYSADEQDLDTILEDIYTGIYEEQQDYYMFSYTSKNDQDLCDYRTIKLEAAEDSIYRGVYEKEFVPVSDVSGDFSSAYANKDYMLGFSSSREVTDADLSGMGLAELRIARNEIFARHGRQFNDAFLNKWFYSKSWYLSIPEKYSPDYFTSHNPNPLSKLEIQNIEFIKSYEDDIIAYSDIFPDASSVLLSEYDLNLSKANLNIALGQVQNYSSSAIRDENLRLIQEAIDREDINY